MSEGKQFETITKSAQSRFVYKRALGGRGEFAGVELRLDPMPSGSGIVFVNELAGYPVPSEFVRAIEETIRSCAQSGGYSRFPVTDLSVALVHALCHELDTNESAFAIATEKSFFDALHKAGPRLVTH